MFTATFDLNSTLDRLVRFHEICVSDFLGMGHAVAQWLRYCVTSRKVTGSRPDDIIEIRQFA
jgi:hypothetical protein